MKVLLICKRRYTNRDLIDDRFGRNYYFPTILRKENIQFTVVAASYARGIKECSTIDKVDFHSIPLRLQSIHFYFWHLNQIIKKQKPDIIMANGDSHFGLLGLLISRRLKVPFLFDVYDQYQSFRSNKLPGMKAIYRMSLRFADQVTCTSQPLVDFIKHYNKKVSYIQNGVDTNIFYPLSKIESRKKLGIKEDDIVIGYFGSMEIMRGVKTLIEACSGMRSEYRHLRLLMAGTPSEEIRLNYDWIDYRGIVSQREISLMINACTVVTLPYFKDPLIDFGNSCKTAEYLACKVPIMSTNVENFLINYPSIAKKLKNALCEPKDPLTMREALRYQIKNQVVADFPKKLSWYYLADKLKETLKSVVVN